MKLKDTFTIKKNKVLSISRIILDIPDDTSDGKKQDAIQRAKVNKDIKESRTRGKLL